MALGGCAACSTRATGCVRSCRRPHEPEAIVYPAGAVLALAAALFWQLMRNAEGDDPTTLESALIGKPLPEFRLKR